MTLAARDMTVEIGGETFRLRPTLRAAMRLEREHGFAELLRLLTDGSLTATTAILAENAHPAPAVALRDIPRLAPVLIAHVLQLAGASDKPATTTPKGKAMSHAAYFDRLFTLGTGALGWTAQATLDTAPAEIEAAYAGRVELLSAIFGGKPDKDDGAPTSSQRDPDAASKLRMLA